jgi:hypothetical protein
MVCGLAIAEIEPIDNNDGKLVNIGRQTQIPW